MCCNEMYMDEELTRRNHVERGRSKPRTRGACFVGGIPDICRS